MAEPDETDFHLDASAGDNTSIAGLRSEIPFRGPDCPSGIVATPRSALPLVRSATARFRIRQTGRQSTRPIKSRPAQPIDRAVAADQGCCLAVVNHRIVFDFECHARLSPVWPAARAPVFRYSCKGLFAEAQPPGGLLKWYSHFLRFWRDE